MRGAAGSAGGSITDGRQADAAPADVTEQISGLTSPDRPVTIVMAVGLLAISIVWWLIELPAAIGGLAGPSGAIDAVVMAAVVVLSLPLLLELATAVLVVLRRGWARFLLVPVLLYYVIGLATGGGPLLLLDLLLVGGALVLLFLPTSRAWFAAHR